MPNLGPVWKENKVPPTRQTIQFGNGRNFFLKPYINPSQWEFPHGKNQPTPLMGRAEKFWRPSFAWIGTCFLLEALLSPFGQNPHHHTLSTCLYEVEQGGQGQVLETLQNMPYSPILCSLESVFLKVGSQKCPPPCTGLAQWTNTPRNLGRCFLNGWKV